MNYLKLIHDFEKKKMNNELVVTLLVGGRDIEDYGAEIVLGTKEGKIGEFIKFEINNNLDEIFKEIAMEKEFNEEIANDMGILNEKQNDKS